MYSVGAPLKLPRRFEGVGNGISAAAGEVSDNHHVLEVPVRHAEGAGKLPHHGVTVIEITTNHHMRTIELATQITLGRVRKSWRVRIMINVCPTLPSSTGDKPDAPRAVPGHEARTATQESLHVNR